MAKKENGPTTRRKIPGRAPRSVTPSRTGQVLLGIFIGGAFVVGVAALVLRSGSGPAQPSLRDLVENVDPGPIHVHGLGINPQDGSLLIATHTGLWRTAPGETQAQRVTNQMQDTMGFTIIGPDRFLGSGHPDQRQARDEGLPPLLGLIESRDAGKSWQTISLLGEADFHVLRSKGNRVYGFDATNERLMFSRDAGRTWAERTPPAPLIDMAVNPSKPSHLIASARTMGVRRRGARVETCRRRERPPGVACPRTALPDHRRRRGAVESKRGQAVGDRGRHRRTTGSAPRTDGPGAIRRSTRRNREALCR